MAPPRLYDSPLEQLSRLMLAARATHVPFGEAWQQAVRPGRAVIMTTSRNAPDGAIRWPTDRTDRIAWMAAINGTREAWRRAYEWEEQTLSDRAVVSLMSALDEGMSSLVAIASAA